MTVSEDAAFSKSDWRARHPLVVARPQWHRNAYVSIALAQLLGAVAIIPLFSVLLRAAESPPPHAFVPAQEVLSQQELSKHSTDPPVVRNRVAGIDVDEVTKRLRSGLPLALNLFEDVTLTTSSINSGQLASGHSARRTAAVSVPVARPFFNTVRLEGGGHMMLFVAENGILRGEAHVPGGASYTIRSRVKNEGAFNPLRSNDVVIQEVKDSSVPFTCGTEFPPEGFPPEGLGPSLNPLPTPDPEAHALLPEARSVSRQRYRPQAQALPSDAPIRVAFLYTTEALEREGGKEQIEATILYDVFQVNQILADSGLSNRRFAIAGMRELGSATEILDSESEADVLRREGINAWLTQRAAGLVHIYDRFGSEIACPHAVGCGPIFGSTASLYLFDKCKEDPNCSYPGATRYLPSSFPYRWDPQIVLDYPGIISGDPQRRVDWLDVAQRLSIADATQRRRSSLSGAVAVPASVSRILTSFGGPTLAHELGHSLGLHHDRGTGPRISHPLQQTYLPFAYGYVTVGDPFCYTTIMAYSTICQRGGWVVKASNFYSNPHLTFPNTDIPAGVPDDGTDTESVLELDPPANAARLIDEVWDYVVKRAPLPICDDLTELTADHYRSLIGQSFTASEETLRPVVHVFRQGDETARHLAIPNCNTYSLTATTLKSFLHPNLRTSPASGYYELALGVDRNYACESRSGEFTLTLETQTGGHYSESVNVIQLGDSQACELISGSDLETLKVAEQSYETLSPAIFSETSHLTSLIWSQNGTREFTTDVFATSFPNLSSLHILRNPVETLPAGLFLELDGLQELRLEGTFLRRLPLGTFSGLSNLAELSVSGNLIDRMEAGIFSELSNLRSLHLNSNRIFTISPGLFEGTSSLHFLNLSSNRISALPPEVFSDLSRLEDLNLQRNRISTRDISGGAFRGLANLKTLDLSYNRMNIQDHGFPPDVFSGLSNLTNLHLNQNPLSIIPSDFFPTLPNVKSLNLQDTQLIELGARAFAGLVQLRALDLSRNRLPTISRDSLVGMTQLQSLSLSHNEIESIDPDSFSDLSLLRTLDLSENQISSFAEDAFAGLEMLDFLDLTNNPLETDSLSSNVCAFLREVRVVRGLNVVRHCGVSLENNISGLVDGDTLNISGSWIGSISADAFSDVPSIRYLVIADNQLRSLPADVFSGLPNLLYLNLNDNQIIEIPDGVFEPLETLQGLYIDGNEISEFRNIGIANLANLKTLSLNRNMIADIFPSIFANLFNLKELRMSENQIQTIPLDLFSGTPELSELELDGNQISKIPLHIFPTLSKLWKLSLRNNMIATIPMGMTSQSLLTLDLGRNDIAQIESNVFSELPRISELRLDRNVLVSVPNNAFSGINHLRSLDLSDNLISTIQVGAFSGHSSLERLDLGGNSITTLSNGVFEGLSSLRELNLSGNRLSAIPDGVLAGIGPIVSLDLSDNPLEDAVFSDGVCEVLKSIPVVLGVSVDERCSSNISDILPGRAPTDVVVNYLGLEYGNRRVAMEFVRIPAGEVVMDHRSEFAGEEVRVKILEDFYISKYEVTNADWFAALDSSHNRLSNFAKASLADCGPQCPFSADGDLDGDGVYWSTSPYDAHEQILDWIANLNRLDGGSKYRLPYEWEWVHAGRSLTSTDTYAGDLSGDIVDPTLDVIAWYQGNSGGRKHPVGRKEANAFGVYDVLGNAMELVQFGEYQRGSDVTDRELRAHDILDREWLGCGYRHAAKFCELPYRDFSPNEPFVNRPGWAGFGFRLVMSDIGEDSVLVKASDVEVLPPVAVRYMRAGRIGRLEYLDYEGGSALSTVTVPKGEEISVGGLFEMKHAYPLEIAIRYEMNFEASDGSASTTAKWASARDGLAGIDFSRGPGSEIPVFSETDSGVRLSASNLLYTGTTEGWVTITARIVSAKDGREFTDFVLPDHAYGDSFPVLPVVRFYVSD